MHIWVNDPSQFGGFKGTLAKWLSIPTPSYMLTYSWGLPSEWQQTFANPHLPERTYISVRRQQSDVGTNWHKEIIDISGDLQQYFERPLITKKLYIAISADTEDSGGSAISEVKDLQISYYPQSG